VCIVRRNVTKICICRSKVTHVRLANELDHYDFASRANMCINRCPRYSSITSFFTFSKRIGFFVQKRRRLRQDWRLKIWTHFLLYLRWSCSTWNNRKIFTNEIVLGSLNSAMYYGLTLIFFNPRGACGTPFPGEAHK